MRAVQQGRVLLAASGIKHDRSNRIRRHDLCNDNVPVDGMAGQCSGAAGSGEPQADLPSDNTVPYWTVLLAAFPGVIVLPTDLMSDDLGRNATVSAAELTELGWRLTVKQAIT